MLVASSILLAPWPTVVGFTGRFVLRVQALLVDGVPLPAALVANDPERHGDGLVLRRLAGHCVYWLAHVAVARAVPAVAGAVAARTAHAGILHQESLGHAACGQELRGPLARAAVERHRHPEQPVGCVHRRPQRIGAVHQDAHPLAVALVAIVVDTIVLDLDAIRTPQVVVVVAVRALQASIAILVLCRGLDPLSIELRIAGLLLVADRGRPGHVALVAILRDKALVLDQHRVGRSGLAVRVSPEISELGVDGRVHDDAVPVAAREREVR